MMSDAVDPVSCIRGPHPAISALTA
jgi:hypothetical protein